MIIFNTLTKRKEKFSPLHSDMVRLYSCGPTVYDNIHIGNLSAFITADTLRRILLISGYKVRHVMNFTDVDDKTISRSKTDYPNLEPGKALSALTEKYSEIFLKDMESIGNAVKDMEFVTATKSIEGMRQLIKELYEDGFAYLADDGVYFSLDKYKKSGKTYGQLLKISSSNTSGARINNDEYDKDSVHDFALWKKQKGDEPSWPLEINDKNLRGRPGWHIECSVMSTQKLGQPFDIHTGGVDLIFPHHENEIAQSTAGKGDVYSNYFVHNEHLLVEGKKMSKSLKNFYTLDDITAKGVDPLAFRLLVLSSHYRSKTDYSQKTLATYVHKLNDLRNWAVLSHQRLTSSSYAQELEQARTEITKCLQDDMNTPEALSVLFPLVKRAEEGADSKSIKEFAKYIDQAFGLDLSLQEDVSKDIMKTIKDREEARLNNDYAKSDQLRDELKLNSIYIKDSPQGPIWQRDN